LHEYLLANFVRYLREPCKIYQISIQKGSCDH